MDIIADIIIAIIIIVMVASFAAVSDHYGYHCDHQHHMLFAMSFSRRIVIVIIASIVIHCAIIRSYEMKCNIFILII